MFFSLFSVKKEWPCQP